jgi:hypothetical protein
MTTAVGLEASLPVRLLKLAARPQVLCASTPFYGWDFPDGTKWAAFYRHPTGILVRFYDLADFELPADGAIVLCAPALGVSDATVEHLFLNQVLPLALSRLGKLVFHASAVAVDGGAVSFSAETGRGKSTLAAAFAADGAPFLTDDGLVLDAEEDGYVVQPSHPSVRLWGDSEKQILGGRARAAPAANYTPKARLLAGGVLPHCGESKPLVAAYFLGDGSAESIAFRRLTPAQALVEWAKNSFLFDIEDNALIANHFDRIVALANRMPSFVLDYPRRYDHLPGVLAAVRNHVKRLSGTR